MTNFISLCYAIRDKADENALIPIAPTIAESECLETTLIYVLRRYNRHPSRSFRRALKIIMKGK